MPDRLFIKVHHNFPEHRKTEELSDKAFRQLITAWCFCARNLTDGHLSDAQARKLFTPKTIGELTKVGYLHSVSSGWEMHQYTEHQMSSADIADLHGKRTAAGSRGGKAAASARASAERLLKQTSSKPVAEVEVEVVSSTDRELVPVSNASENNVYNIQDEPRSKSYPSPIWKLAKGYAAKVNPSNPANIAGHILNATATWDMDLIAKAVEKMAKEARSLSADSLRIELNQLGCDKSGMQRLIDGSTVDWNTGIRRSKNGIPLSGGGYRSGQASWSDG